MSSLWKLVKSVVSCWIRWSLELLLKQLCYYRTILSLFREESFHLHLQCKHPNYPSLHHEAGIVWTVRRLQSLNEGHLNYINIKVYGPLMVMQRNISLCKSLSYERQEVIALLNVQNLDCFDFFSLQLHELFSVRLPEFTSSSTLRSSTKPSEGWCPLSHTLGPAFT